MHTLVAPRWVLGRSVIWRATSRAAGTGTTRRRRASCLVWATMTVGVGLVVATGWRPGPDIVRIFRVTRTRSTILIGSWAATRRGASVSGFTPVIELARRRTSAVVFAARAVATGRSATVVVFVVRSGRVAAATATATSTAAYWRAGSEPVTTTIIWSTRASVRSPGLEGRRRGRIRNILLAGNFLSLELLAVQLVSSGLQVGRRLVLDESATVSAKDECGARSDAPSAIALAANFGVDDVQSRLAGKVFQVLHMELGQSNSRVNSTKQDRDPGTVRCCCCCC
jgi:hypothetical protein